MTAKERLNQKISTLSPADIVHLLVAIHLRAWDDPDTSIPMLTRKHLHRLHGEALRIVNDFSPTTAQTQLDLTVALSAHRLSDEVLAQTEEMMRIIRRAESPESRIAILKDVKNSAQMANALTTAVSLFAKNRRREAYETLASLFIDPLSDRSIEEGLNAFERAQAAALTPTTQKDPQDERTQRDDQAADNGGEGAKTPGSGDQVQGDQ